MNILKNEFIINGLQYTLIKRNDKVALFNVNGNHFEVSRIYIIKEHKFKGKIFYESEQITPNSKFGFDKSICLKKENWLWAYKYFDWLTEYLNLTEKERKYFKKFSQSPCIEKRLKIAV